MALKDVIILKGGDYMQSMQYNRLFYLFVAILSWGMSIHDGQAQETNQDLRNAGYTRPGTVEDLIKIRCGLKGQDAWTLWTGEIYSYVPKERQKKLFTVVGANVARCQKLADGSWYFTSRELQYYLDPKTGQRLDQWKNPWTQKVVPVMHVANDLVQGKLNYKPDLTIDPPFVTLRMPINLFYPNRLAKKPDLKPFGSYQMYQAGEFFGLLSPLKDLKDPNIAQAAMSLTWTRIGPWLPWMDMEEQEGYLVYSADGSKLKSFTELPAWLQKEIKTHLPRYEHAPTCLLDRRNTSSWTYFDQNFEAYKQKKRFPLAAPVVKEKCREK